MLNNNNVDNAAALITLNALSKSFGGHQALKNITLTLNQGEVHCLAGANGCGKSTLIKTISGVYAPDAVPLPEDGGWLACGNGLAAYPALRERLSAIVDSWQPEIMPSAEAVVRLAAQAFARSERIDPADAVPFYVRNKVAQTVVERLAAG